MLKEISVRNFKSWERVEHMRLAPITGLFGANSSGKTSLLQLLLMLKQTVESSDRALVLEFGDEQSLTNLGGFRDLIFAHEPESSLEFSLAWDLPQEIQIRDPEKPRESLFSGKDMRFGAVISEGKGERLRVDSFFHELSGNTFRMKRKEGSAAKYELTTEAGAVHLVRNVGRAWDLPAPVKFYGFPDHVYAYYQNAGFLADLQLEFENLLGNIYYLGPLRDFPQRDYRWKGAEPSDMGRRGERVVDALLASESRGRYISPGHKKHKKSLQERVAYWLKELGLIESFEVVPIDRRANLYQVLVQKTSRSAPVLITDVGFGVSQVLPIIALCYYVPKNSTILLEQPEIHLHPSVQSGLADVFLDAMENRSVQIILESHSEHLLRRLQRRIAEGRSSRNEISLYFCRMADGKTTLDQLELDLFGYIANWPDDFFGDPLGETVAMEEAMLKRRMAAGG